MSQQTNGAPRQRKLVLTNVSKGRWWLFLLKLFGFLLMSSTTVAVCAYFAAAAIYSDGLPDFPRVDEYRPPILSEVYTADGVLAGEFYNERRKVVPYERIPKRLVQAFIAAEDADFFDHWGIDLWGTARAAFKTINKKLSGKGRVQGGSTLTQQTAKAVLTSAEGYKEATAKTIKRKIREALLARRLESELTKEEILYLYLNNVYLGHHSYGVQSAAENYYRKDVSDLTLAEMALIAGLPQAPSTYSPFRNREAAKKRRQYVLGQMLEKGMISKTEHTEASQAEVSVYPVEDVFHQFAPYYTEEVRRDVVNRYGNQMLLNGGLKIFTTMDSEKQRAAQQAVLTGLLAVDKRQGFRGPVAHYETKAERDQFIDKSRSIVGKSGLEPSRYYVGLVTAVAVDGKTADINVGGNVAKLPILGMRWAREVNANRSYVAEFINKTNVLKVGDVVVVKVVADAKGLVDDREIWSEPLAREVPKDATIVRLEQEPEPQAALVSIDPHRQYLVAMVGGYDFDANEYNRAFQACRQPGSSFKPLVYAGAVEKMGWTEGTVVLDAPIVYDDPANQSRWKPENYDENFEGEIIVRNALVKSKNIPAVRTFIALAQNLGNKHEVQGIQKIADFVKTLGLSTPLNLDYSAALGSSCVYPYELAQVYATLNRLGSKKPTYFIRKIEDRFGRTLEDHTSYDDPWANTTDRIAAGYARLFEPGTQVLSRETAFVVTDMMRGVVREGTGAAANALKKPAAGKTGTTNDSFDAWFTAFTRDLVTTAWVGYDLNPHPLGRYETGGRAALPIWLAYMQKALEGREQPEFEKPADLALVQERVSNKTGKLAKGGKDTSLVWFKEDEVPKESEPDRGTVDANQFLQLP